MRNQTGTKDFYLMLLDRLARLPQATAIGVIDDKGMLWNTRAVGQRQSSICPIANISSSTSAPTSHRLFISTPIQNRINGVWTMQFSRRINGPNGEFLGVIFVGADTAYFKEIFSSIETLNNQKITLARSDGMIIAEYPAPDSVAGRKIPAGLTVVPAWCRRAAAISGRRILPTTSRD